jgi:GT2 family glycosyltransferase
MSIEKTFVYILSRDRPIYFKAALNSVLMNCSELVTIVISDNSVGNDVEEMMRNEYSSLLYIRRSPPIPVIDHFRIIFQEAEGDYLVLFHDDDIMMPSYMDKMLAMLMQNPTLVAVGCNATKMRGDIKTDELYMRDFSQPKLISDVKVLLPLYLNFSLNVPPPFPSYIYRRRLMAGVLPDHKQGGKYCDVSFLAKLTVCGPILWAPESLMWYRLHSSNDSSHESIVDRLSLLRYLIAFQNVSPKASYILEFKCLYWSNWWLDRGVGSKLFMPHGWRERVVVSFLLKNALKLIVTRLVFWRLFFAFMKKLWIRNRAFK